MVGLITALCVSFAVVVVVVPVVIRAAYRHAWFDRPNERKIHTGEIPRLGGIAIFIGIVSGSITGILVLASTSGPLRGSILEWGLALAGLSLMFAVGLVDDFTNIPALRKLLGQLLAAAVISISGFHIDTVLVPFTGHELVLGWLSYPLTMLWIVGIANAVNLIDGMDGCAVGIALIASAAFAVIGAFEGADAVVLLSLVVFGASAAFLLFNRPPAHIFMGDSGSLLLGTLLASIPLFRGAAMAHRPALNLLVPATVLLIPILDTASAILRRVRRHQPIHQADNEHIHHKLLYLLGTTRGALSVLYVFQVFLGAVAVVSLFLAPVLGVSLLLAVWGVSIAVVTTTHTYYLRVTRAGDAHDRPEAPKPSSKAI